MSVRIRVYPNYGGIGGMYGGFGGVDGGYGVQAQLTQQQLQNERQTSNLKLQYERALWSEKLKQVELTSALQYSGAAGNPYMMRSMAVPGYAGYPGAYMGANALGIGGMGMGMGMGLGLGLGGIDSMVSSLMGPVSGVFV